MRKTVFSLINYIGCIGIALFVTFIIDGTIGMVLTYALITALVVSLLMTLAVIRSVSIQPALSVYAVSKGDMLSFEIGFINSSFLPVPSITVEIDTSAHFTVKNDTVGTVSLTGKGKNTLSFPMTAKHSGKAYARIKSVKLNDFLGIFSFYLKNPEINTELTAAIYPIIPDASVQTNFVITATKFADNDDEEESDESSAIPTGLAGYDHREYVPGDPIKRISWKLSSKQDKLMVRLDEKIKGSGRIFLLDCPVTEENDIALTVRDNVIEGALALLNSLLSEGREATVFYCKRGLWMSVDIHTVSDIYTLQEEMSDFEPSENASPVPPELNSALKTPICFTSAMNGNSFSAEEIASRYPDSMIISSYASSLTVVSDNQWMITDSFELNRM